MALHPDVIQGKYISIEFILLLKKNGFVAAQVTYG